MTEGARQRVIHSGLYRNIRKLIQPTFNVTLAWKMLVRKREKYKGREAHHTRRQKAALH
jgi:hypothetical protein